MNNLFENLGNALRPEFPIEDRMFQHLQNLKDQRQFLDDLLANYDDEAEPKYVAMSKDRKWGIKYRTPLVTQDPRIYLIKPLEDYMARIEMHALRVILNTSIHNVEIVKIDDALLFDLILKFSAQIDEIKRYIDEA